MGSAGYGIGPLGSLSWRKINAARAGFNRKDSGLCMQARKRCRRAAAWVFSFAAYSVITPSSKTKFVLGECDMNKNVLIGIVLIALAGGAYYQFSYKPAQVAAMAKAAEDAATKAADEAAATAKAAEDAAAAAAKKLADDAAAAAAAGTAAATDGAAAVTDAATAAMAALDPANFDAAKINAMIDASALDAAMKTTLKAGIDAAAADPAKIAEALAAVKTAMGM